MWRPRLVISNYKIITKSLCKSNLCSSSYPNRNNNKTAFHIITVTGLAVVSTVIYAKYESRFKHFLGTNVPYIDRIYKFFSEGRENQSESREIYVSDRKQRDSEKEEISNSIEKKFPVGRSSDNDVSDQSFEKKSENQIRNVFSDDKKHIDKIKVITTEPNAIENDLKSSEVKEDITSTEDALNERILEARKILGETIIAYRVALNAIKFYNEKLNEAIGFSDYDTDEAIWREVNEARTEKENILNFARKKTAEIKFIFENLKSSAKRLLELNVCSSLAMHGEKAASECLLVFCEGEKEIRSTGKEEAKEVIEYEKILKGSKELFERELETILPNKIQADKGKVEDDSNLLIAHAHNKNEQLHEEITRFQKTEEKSINKVEKNEKMPDEYPSDIVKQGHLLELDKILESRLESTKIDFDDQLHKLLVRQVAVHADYLEKSLKLQELELTRKFSLELEEKLLHQKEGFVSAICENMSRLKVVTEYLKRMNECNKSIENVKSLWIACQGMHNKIMSQNLSPLTNDAEKIKTLFDEDNAFIPLVIDSIPEIALNRGVYTAENLKQRFSKVKIVCRKVALIDENNDSLYRYFLSVLQSFLVIDTALTRKDFEGEEDVDNSNLDTFDILQRITYFLETGNLEKSLHFANQLKGEPRVVAQDWINEFTHMLEARLVLKTLIAYAAAVSIQVYN